jgi:tetratricopeptide (TPR) repeat protein
MFPVLRGLASYYLYLGMFENAAQMGEKIINLAERLDDVNMRVEGYLVLGYNTAFLGDVNQGLELLDKAGASYDPARFRRRSFSLGNSPGVVRLAVSALLLWVQGLPERALQQGNHAIDLATRLGHPYSIAYALFHTSLLHLWRREAELAQANARAVLNIAEEHKYLAWKAVATCMHGAALAQMGQPEEGLVQILEGMRQYQVLPTPPVFWTMLLYLQAEAYGHLGQPAQGLEALDQARAIIGVDSEDIFAPEFYRLRGDLLLAQSSDHAPEANFWFERALEVAQKRELPMLELRAAVRLYRLWQNNLLPADPNKAGQARELLSSIYHKFSEGFTTSDLVEARGLLNN